MRRAMFDHLSVITLLQTSVLAYTRENIEAVGVGYLFLSITHFYQASCYKNQHNDFRYKAHFVCGVVSGFTSILASLNSLIETETVDGKPAIR